MGADCCGVVFGACGCSTCSCGFTAEGALWTVAAGVFSTAVSAGAGLTGVCAAAGAVAGCWGLAAPASTGRRTGIGLPFASTLLGIGLPCPSTGRRTGSGLPFASTGRRLSGLPCASVGACADLCCACLVGIRDMTPLLAFSRRNTATNFFFLGASAGAASTPAAASFFGAGFSRLRTFAARSSSRPVWTLASETPIAESTSITSPDDFPSSFASSCTLIFPKSTTSVYPLLRLLSGSHWRIPHPLRPRWSCPPFPGSVQAMLCPRI